MSQDRFENWLASPLAYRLAFGLMVCTLLSIGACYLDRPVCTCVLDHPDYYARHMAEPEFQYNAPEDCLAHGKDAE